MSTLLHRITSLSFSKLAVAILALLVFILAACAPGAARPPASMEPTKPANTAVPPTEPARPANTATPAAGLSGLHAEDILIQLTYEPGFSLPEYRFPFGRTPYFTLLADGRVIYIDENQDSRVMMAQLSQAEAAALLQKVRDMGFAHLESHTDMCGKMADGSESCIADAPTSVMRVRMEDGSLREIRNYARFSNGPMTYEAIYNLLDEYAHPQAAIYVPHAATLFVHMAPPPEQASPADWPLDPAYVKHAQAAAEQSTAVVLSAEEAAKWQKEVGINNASITFQLAGQPVSAYFVPWLPGEDFAADVAAAFPAQ